MYMCMCIDINVDRWTDIDRYVCACVSVYTYHETGMHMYTQIRG